MPKRFWMLNVLLVATLFLSSVALAQEGDPGKVTLSGTIGAIGDGYIEFVIDRGDSFQTLKVFLMEPLNTSGLHVGDVIEVSGYYNGEELIVASEIRALTPETNSIPRVADNYAQAPSNCGHRSRPHPIAAGIAETYATEYETVMLWICERGYDFGEVALALQTAELIGGDPEKVLQEKEKNGGWGRMWVSHGLISNEGLADAPAPTGQTKMSEVGDEKLPKGKGSPPDHAQSPGPPGDEFTPPGQENSDKDKELPENAGPPDGSAPPGQLKEKDKGQDKVKDKDKSKTSKNK